MAIPRNLALACLSIVSAVALAGCTSAPPPVPPGIPQIPTPASLTLTPGNWNSGVLEIDIDTALYADNVTIPGLSYIITDGNQTVRFSGAASSPQTNGGVTTTVAYLDNSNTGKVNAGDKFRVTLSPDDGSIAQSGWFQVFFNGEEIADVSI